jgi:hypothetical protein
MEDANPFLEAHGLVSPSKDSMLVIMGTKIELGNGKLVSLEELGFPVVEPHGERIEIPSQSLVDNGAKHF